MQNDSPALFAERHGSFLIVRGLLIGIGIEIRYAGPKTDLGVHS
jgi:hypothetical protein